MEVLKENKNERERRGKSAATRNEAVKIFRLENTKRIWHIKDVKQLRCDSVYILTVDFKTFDACLWCFRWSFVQINVEMIIFWFELIEIDKEIDK